MAEFLVTCSLAIYLIALLYAAYRIFTSRRAGRSVIREHYRKSRLFSHNPLQTHATPDLSCHYV